MSWRIVVLGVKGLLTAIISMGRFEAGTTGFLLWAPILTSALSFCAVILMLRAGPNDGGRNRI